MGAGRFTPERSRRALATICAAVGLDCSDAVPVKLTVNAVYRLPSAGVIVRIARSPALTHRVETVVTVARWLAQQEIPAVRLLPGVPAPVRADGVVGTLWVDASRPGRAGREPARGLDGPGSPPIGRRTTATELATALRRMHALSPPNALPRWDPLDDVERRIDDAEGLAPADRVFLRDMTDRLRAALADVTYELPPVLLHGDAHLGNLLRAADGRAVLCDFDSSCVGPAEWDLVPVAVGRIRFRYPAEQQRELAAGYGFDVTTWPGFGVLRAVRELKLVTSVVPLLASSPAIAAQFALRMASLRYRDESVRWYPYS
jgi:aminoglycoside phosphotransferase (APT) family kinase protein